jgi:hypothetical protein
MLTLVFLFITMIFVVVLHICQAGKHLQQGDKIGWGIQFPPNDDNQTDEQLIICYLTINRVVSYVRVLCQPTGGFYPVIIAPPNG